MGVIPTKLVIFLAFILCVAIFAGFFVFIFIRKNEKPGDRKSRKKKKKKKKGQQEEEIIYDNPGKFSEVENKGRKQRLSHKEKYPQTQTLTNLLDIEDDEASEDFTTSLLSERELNENPHFSEIVFESASLAEAGEVFGTEAEIDQINALDERTQLLEDMELGGTEAECGTALLFDEDAIEFNSDQPESSSIVEEKDQEARYLTVEGPKTPVKERKYYDIKPKNSPIVEEIKQEAEEPLPAPAEDNPEGDSIVKEKEQEEKNPPAEEYYDAKSQTPSIVEPKENFNNCEPEGGSNLFIGKLIENTEFNDLDNPVFLNCELRGCSFSDKAFANAKFIGSKLISCSFLGAEMPDSSFDNVSAINCSFKFASLPGASIINSIFQDCGFEKADFDESIIEKTQFTECRFDKKTSFNNAILKEADFDSKDGPDLSKVGHII